MLTSDLGDHIGMESCVDMETGTIPPPSFRSVHTHKPWRSLNSIRKCRQLPPPLPIQSSTVMKRYYTEDGRLVITEEKIESPKFHFTSVRSHGRLTIQLVNDDNDNDNDNDGDYEKKCFSYNTVARVAAATGSCLFVNNQNELHAIRPVQI